LKKTLVTLMAVCFCIVASQNARAEANLGLRSAGVQVGMVSPENLDTILGFGGFADWGTITPNIRLASHIDYWSKSQDDGFGDKVSISDVAVTMRAKYMIQTTSPRFQPFMGAGLGIHFLSAKMTVPGAGSVSDGTNKLGIDLGGGFSSPLNERTSFVGEAWYGIVDGFNQFQVKAGLGWALGR
jgi:hypothetical protein